MFHVECNLKPNHDLVYEGDWSPKRALLGVKCYWVSKHNKSERKEVEDDLLEYLGVDIEPTTTKHEFAIRFRGFPSVEITVKKRKKDGKVVCKTHFEVNKRVANGKLKYVKVEATAVPPSVQKATLHGTFNSEPVVKELDVSGFSLTAFL